MQARGELSETKVAKRLPCGLPRKHPDSKPLLLGDVLLRHRDSVSKNRQI